MATTIEQHNAYVLELDGATFEELEVTCHELFICCDSANLLLATQVDGLPTTDHSGLNIRRNITFSVKLAFNQPSMKTFHVACLDFGAGPHTVKILAV